MRKTKCSLLLAPSHRSCSDVESRLNSRLRAHITGRWRRLIALRLLAMRASCLAYLACGLRPARIAWSVDRGNPVRSMSSRSGMALSLGRTVAHSSCRGSTYSVYTSLGLVITFQSRPSTSTSCPTSRSCYRTGQIWVRLNDPKSGYLVALRSFRQNKKITECRRLLHPIAT